MWSFDSLADFIDQATEGNKHFVIFPYSLSKYLVVENLPSLIDDVENLPEEPDDWFHYFPQAKPWEQGWGIFTMVLIGLSLPFAKFIKKLSPWCKEEKWTLAFSITF